MKYNIYDADKVQRDEVNSPIKFGYFTQKRPNIVIKSLIDIRSTVVYEDKHSDDASRICLKKMIDQIQEGDHVYIGREFAFSSNKQLHYAYCMIIEMKGGKVFDLSNVYDLERLKLTNEGA